MIDLQKKYAKDLLGHVNPYTKTAYKDEPAVAFVEISNEDALFAVWGWGQLDDLPDPYATTFRKLWNAWLRKKYGTTEKLREAWLEANVPVGENLLENGDFFEPIGRFLVPGTGRHVRRLLVGRSRRPGRQEGPPHRRRSQQPHSVATPVRSSRVAGQGETSVHALVLR